MLFDVAIFSHDSRRAGGRAGPAHVIPGWAVILADRASPSTEPARLMQSAPKDIVKFRKQAPCDYVFC